VSYLAFAVADTSGACAGGIIETTETKPATVTTVTPEAVPAGGTCSGDAVATAAGY